MDTHREPAQDDFKWSKSKKEMDDLHGRRSNIYDIYLYLVAPYDLHLTYISDIFNKKFNTWGLWDTTLIFYQPTTPLCLDILLHTHTTYWALSLPM